MRNIAIIGLGGFGSSVARELTEKGIQVLAIDRDSELVESCKDSVTHAVTLDAMDERALRSVGIDDMDVAVVCIGEDIEANLLTTILLRKLGVHHIWTRAHSPLQKEILRVLEVDQIINLEEDMGRFIASSLVSSSISRHIPLADGHAIVEVKIPDSMLGKTIRTIDPRKEYKVNVVAIKKMIPEISAQGERLFETELEAVPDPDRLLTETDSLLIAGTDKNIERFASIQ